MRTTLELDDDLLATARNLARERGVSLGLIITELAQQALAAATSPKVRNGFRLLTPNPRAHKVDLDFVNRLRDEE